MCRDTVHKPLVDLEPMANDSLVSFNWGICHCNHIHVFLGTLEFMGTSFQDFLSSKQLECHKLPVLLAHLEPA